MILPARERKDGVVCVTPGKEIIIMAFNKLRTIMFTAALLLAGGAAPMAQAAQEYSAQYAKDRAEIEDLMGRYLFALDYNNFDDYVATFTEDGELEFASGLSKGRDTIRAAVTRFKQGIGQHYKSADGSPATLRHVLLQNVMRIEGDRAWTRSLWVEMANDGPEGALKMGTFGTYEDELKRVNGRWLFSKRRVLNEFIKGRHSGPGDPVIDMDKIADAMKAR